MLKYDLLCQLKAHYYSATYLRLGEREQQHKNLNCVCKRMQFGDKIDFACVRKTFCE